MTAYVIRRALAFIPVIFVVSLLTFGIMHLAPGGPFSPQEGRRNDETMRQRQVEAFGLDKSWPEQYIIYMSHAVTLDLGPSFAQKGRNVTDLIRDQFPF